MQSERLRELPYGRSSTAREMVEKAQLVRSSQGLEGPETGRKRHQRDGGRKLLRGSQLIGCLQSCLARDRSGLTCKRCRARSGALKIDHGSLLEVRDCFAASSCTAFLEARDCTTISRDRDSVTFETYSAGSSDTLFRPTMPHWPE